jgi:quercetin dioxygenase-like cupin family protein
MDQATHTHTYKGTGPDPLDGRVVRFDALEGNGTPLMFIDSVLPTGLRMNYSLVGDVASENPDYRVMTRGDHTFQVAIFMNPPGCGPNWHTHDYVEAFMPLSGRFEFLYGADPEGADDPDGAVTLDPWDFISLPARTWRAFRNVSDEMAWCLGILEAHAVFEGVDPYWPESTKEAARAYGIEADAKGKMIKPDNYDELVRELSARLPFAPRDR